MTIDQNLLEILACPCPEHAPLVEVASGLQCQSCHRIFPITDGIPVLLLDQASTGGPAASADPIA